MCAVSARSACVTSAVVSLLGVSLGSGATGDCLCTRVVCAAAWERPQAGSSARCVSSGAPFWEHTGDVRAMWPSFDGSLTTESVVFPVSYTCFASACACGVLPAWASCEACLYRCTRRGVRVATWLILPVVICLSQRLSHACLSISDLYCETANGSLNQLWFL